MAKKVDHAKAKAAKQRKLAIGLSVLLLVVLAIQGPRTLKMLKGPSVPVAAATPAPATSPTGTTEAAVPPLGAPAAAAGALASSAEPAVLASTEQPLAGPGQLLSFELFESKDPFVQQVEVGSPAPSAEPAAGGNAQGDGTAGADPNPPAADAGGRPAAGGSAVPPAAGGGSTFSPAKPEEPAAAPAAATTISVNGVSGTADIGKKFPLEDPVFVLVSTASDGKSVEIGIAGGTYADGEDTITLKLGKPVTLQNTADGSRYELVLKTIAGFVPPDSKK